MLKTLAYSASARETDVASLVTLLTWSGNCPLLENVSCSIDCANSGNVEILEAALMIAAKHHPNYPKLKVERENYDRPEGRSRR